ncbi:hypothetical protein [Acinetobacter sp. WCHAc010034]|uniref:hypothetical protein n=1 Tax=Acinetobacter sp. WCHAc010034 TaxID=1879049 RepID=UPI001D18C81D|nr:hypothetical protein [Acinetobacter sp. WCHAc010034]
MQYKEYLNSARKHQYTCEEILKCIKSNSATTSQEKVKQKQLIFNLFYLSGYIIECSVKYGIYHLISYDRNKPVKELNQNDLTFDRHIKVHKFERYTDAFNKLQGGYKLIDNTKDISPEVIQIYKNWDAEVRYWFNQSNMHVEGKITLKNVETFYKLANEIMQEIQRL